MGKHTLLTDGGWFDSEKATEFEEDSRFDGHNHISLATGSQWDHEGLYLTASGRWVRYTWSQYQSVPETYEEIPEPEAVDWLIRQGYADRSAELPAKVASALAAQLAKTEI